jgi:radical SAM superfamily enzyme YgiQ (UPF0313 family)
MPDILLTTLNAKYAHAAFGLRYLMANLAELSDRAAILEFDVNQRPMDVLEVILAQNPKIVGIGVYIWNVSPATQLVAELKRLRPDVTIVIGGPEVSYETDQQEIARHADYVITGEADLAFAELCRTLLSGKRPLMKVIPAELPEFDKKAHGSPSVVVLRSIALPYHLYTDHDLTHRVIYVEASRGCPFKCEFCLSSLDIPVRNAPLDDFLGAMQSLLDRGARQFKFVDRTFNLNVNIGTAILRFFRERYTPGLFLHFEMIPDKLPAALREEIAKFPAGAMQFEVGIQTFNDDVAELISRRQNNEKVAENFLFLRDQTGVHVHADLIVGLPGEDMASFASGFDRLVAMRPQEIQVGMLKRLRGTPIVRHDERWGMIYSPNPPYEILQTRLIDFAAMQRLRRFARYWDLIANSGNFIDTSPLIWADASPFWKFMELSDSIFARIGRQHAIALPRLMELLYEHLTNDVSNETRQTIGRTMAADYLRNGRRDLPEFLRDFAEVRRHDTSRAPLPRRQARHLAN